MNTKILKSPFPEDQPGNNGRGSQKFNLEDRKISVDWDLSPGGKVITPVRHDSDTLDTISLFIVSQNIELVVDLDDTTYIGRSYPQTGSFDGIDFSAFDAYKQGVSRRHVILKRDSGKVFIADNNSTNGTYLNRALLEPLKPYVLEHNDELRLGAFEVRLRLD